MIHAENLSKRFGDTLAVDRVSLDVADGEVFGLLGPNGAGKTTTIRMLSGLISTSEGTAEVAGCRIGREDEQLRLRRQLGVLPENVGLYEGSTAYENLEYFGQLNRMETTALRANAERLLRSMDLWEKRDATVETFSKGMRQKLAIARSLIHDPVLLFLDEPTANLDPEAAKMVRDTILQLRGEHRTIVLNTHNLDEAQRVCDRVGLLRTRLVTVGRPGELRARFSGHRTVVRLAQVTDALVAAIRQRLAPRTVAVDGDRLVVEVADPDRDNPEIAEAVVAAGGRIRELAAVQASLEDVYLQLIHQARAGP